MPHYKKVYECYKDDGEIVYTGPADEIAQKLEVGRGMISFYANKNYQYAGLYRFRDTGEKTLAKPASPYKRKKKQTITEQKIIQLCADIGDTVEIINEFLPDPVEVCKIIAKYNHLFTVKRKAGYIEAFTYKQLYMKDGVRLSKRKNIFIQSAE